MSDISSVSSAGTPSLRLVRYDSAARPQAADDREQQLSAQLERRITTQLGQIRQRMAGATTDWSGSSASAPGGRLDILA